MKREQERYPKVNPKLKAVTELEPLLDAILKAERRPTDEERLEIVKVLYEASAADPR